MTNATASITTKYLLSPSTHHSYNSEAVIEFCLQASRTLDHLKQTHARLLRTQINPHPRLIIHLTSRLLQLPGNSLRYARCLFDRIPHCENQFIWTSIIRSHTLHAQFSQSIALYAQMHRMGISPNGFTFSSVLNACARIPAILQGRQIHTQIVQSGYFSNTVVQTALLDVYAKCGAANDARRVFDQMTDRDVVSWTAMVSGYSKVGMMEDARQLFDVMVERNVVSWTAMVAGYANAGDIGAAKALFDKMPEKNSITRTAMIAGYGKCGDVVGARQVFDKMAMRDSACWAAMIACYARNGCSSEAIELYKRMRMVNVKANEVAMVGVISACTQLGDVDMASSIADDMNEGSCERTVVVSNALIHMNAKCGSVVQAWEEFNLMTHRDVISYSALITALADHGRAHEALQLFSRMRKEGLRPNEVTFVGVLNACSHAGMVEEGCEYFKLMKQSYGIVPLTEHYACMVDLLGRAGRLEEAYKLILDSVVTPDAGTWGALLGACRVHGNVELGEIAAGHLFELEPENTGNYVLLANIYASMNRWDDAERVRKMMSERRIRKSPGCSWIGYQDSRLVKMVTDE
ncbi:putative pentatricopeptide repeat-containing protein At5g37570 [Macadamia integrifolia]|uniref:putative pentatricopeptide repeat-containing protein At5g37570 n=1 Tax=Macadamia integrifolia TaxID=60698 RepID=UPI001C4F59A5|nr:putative pentatricopeptide repeat-containing protein At5g37570 [Macadamia integrifolia]